MKSSGKMAVLTSGGLDSAILVHQLLKSGATVYPIYIRSGHVWENAELYWLKRYLKAVSNRRLKSLTILSCETGDLYKGHWSLTGKKIPNAESNDRKVYLPGKNLLLITKAAVYCSLNKIPALALAPLKTNPFPDAKASFFQNLGKVCSQGLNFKLTIQTPFLTRTKKEVMALGKNLPLGLTFSCLAPITFSHCGKCNKCAERKKALRYITP